MEDFGVMLEDSEILPGKLDAIEYLLGDHP